LWWWIESDGPQEIEFSFRVSVCNPFKERVSVSVRKIASSAEKSLISSAHAMIVIAEFKGGV
jgi:hypothetical protein